MYVVTDDALLRHALHFNGDNLEVNRLLMKIAPCPIEVLVKPETYKALRFSKLLAGQDQVNEMNALEALLIEYERERPIIQEKIVTEESQTNFEGYAYIGMFDGACTRKKCPRPLGAYGWVIYDTKGQKVTYKSGRVDEDEVTNNVAESVALEQLVRWFLQVGDIEGKR